MSPAAASAIPLKVLARLLELRHGRAEDLHVGLFLSADEPVELAQRRATELLRDALPPPGRLLAVGVGSGATLARLKEAGFEATGISPDAGQVQAARARHGDAISVEQAHLADFGRDAGQWQALLFHESAQDLRPVALFEAAERLLHDGPSTLLVMGEFALDRRDDTHRGLHTLKSFCALAERQGWALTKRMDLSQQARPMLDWLLAGLDEHGARLMSDLHLTREQLAAMAASLTRHQGFYDDGVYGYALLRFDRSAKPEHRLVETGPAHAPAMRQLFADVFQHEMTPEHWQWKYGDGRGYGVAVLRDDRMIAYYGGVTRAVLCRGEPVLASQSCDVMVDRRAVSGLARLGPMAQVGATYIETQLGWGQPHRIGFGFPNDRHFGVARRLGLYAAVDTVTRASWPPSPGRAGREVVEQVQAADLLPGGRRRAAISGLWRQMAESLRDAVIGVRDADWLHHRYFARPGVSYEAFYLRRRWTRRPVGAVVLRRHDAHLEVLDLIGPPSTFATLIAFARQRAADLGLKRIDCWVTVSHLHLLSSIDPAAFSATPLHIVVPTNVHTPGPVDELKDRWFLLAGDADFT